MADVTPQTSNSGLLKGLRWLLVRALIVFSSIVITLLALEVFMRVGFDLLPPQLQGNIQSVRVVPWDERPMVLPVPFEADTGYQARLAPGYEDYPVRWMDARFAFTTVNLPDWEHPVGLRTAPFPDWPVDLIAFGDSFTFCWTDINDCWVQRLQSDYDLSIINAGMPGTGPTGQAKLIEEIAIPIGTPLVVWQRYTNDSFDDYTLHWLRGEAPGLASAPAVAPAYELQGMEKYSALLAMIANIQHTQSQEDPFQHSQLLDIAGRQMLVTTNEYPHGSSTYYPAVQFGWKRNVEAYLSTVKRLRTAIDAEVVFVIIPTKEEAYADYLTDTLGEDYMMQLGENRRLMLQQCAYHSWHCVDTLPAFQEAIANGETVYYAQDFHLDESGNAIVARLVSDYIRENDLLTQSSDT